MRVRTPHSGVEVEFHVAVNDRQCEEYLLLDRSTRNDDTQPLKECYVPVMTGQHITIYGYLTGRLTHARFDLLADGSYVGTRVVESGKAKTTKQHHRRRIDFRTIQTILDDPSGLASIVEADLCTKPLPPGTSDFGEVSLNGKAFGVGSLVVLVSLLEESGSGETYEPDMRELPDCTFYSWKTRTDTVYDAGIEPTDSLSLRDTSHSVTPQKANTFRMRYNDGRFGKKVFAKLVFYYRNKGAIIEAGCLPLPQRAYLVEQEYVELPPIISPPSESTGKVTQEGDLFIGHNPRVRKKARLGGLLVLPASGEPSITFTQLVKILDAERQTRRHANSDLVREQFQQEGAPSTVARGAPSSLAKTGRKRVLVSPDSDGQHDAAVDIRSMRQAQKLQHRNIAPSTAQNGETFQSAGVQPRLQHPVPSRFMLADGQGVTGGLPFNSLPRQHETMPDIATDAGGYHVMPDCGSRSPMSNARASEVTSHGQDVTSTPTMSNHPHVARRVAAYDDLDDDLWLRY